MLKSELNEPVNAKLREKLAAIRAGAGEPERHTVTAGPMRDARGAVVEFHAVSLGVPGNAGPRMVEVIPPTANATRFNCQSTAPMRYAQPVSICRLVNESERATSPLDARIRVLEARLGALEFAGGVGVPEVEKPVQEAVAAPTSVFATDDYARHRAAKLVAERYREPELSQFSYGRQK